MEGLSHRGLGLLGWGRAARPEAAGLEASDQIGASSHRQIPTIAEARTTLTAVGADRFRPDRMAESSRYIDAGFRLSSATRSAGEAAEHCSGAYG